MGDTSFGASTTGSTPIEESLKLVYVLTTNGRDSYANMAMVSILSANLSNPGISTFLLVDADSLEALRSHRHKILELNVSILAIDTPPGSAVFRSRWIKTQVGRLVRGNVAYLDADTLVRKSIGGLRQIGAVFSTVADAPSMEPDPRRLRISQAMGWDPNRTYYNSGFFFYRSTPEVDRFFEKWHALWYDAKSETNHEDQPAFNAAITLADFDTEELSETYNHQIAMSWTDCHKSNVWHFWESSRMPGDILEELTILSADLPINELSKNVRKAIAKRTPAAHSNRLALGMDLLSVDTELQRKLLIQKSRLSAKEFMQWSLQKLLNLGTRQR